MSNAICRHGPELDEHSEKADNAAYTLTAQLTGIDCHGHRTWFDMEDLGVWYVAAVRHHKGRKCWQHFVIDKLLMLAVFIGKHAAGSNGQSQRKAK